MNSLDTGLGLGVSGINRLPVFLSPPSSAMATATSLSFGTSTSRSLGGAMSVPLMPVDSMATLSVTQKEPTSVTGHISA
ncbi:unnamed protein product, partial [Protopolystoma xenopodis]